jgi:hypothetical protein
VRGRERTLWMLDLPAAAQLPAAGALVHAPLAFVDGWAPTATLSTALSSATPAAAERPKTKRDTPATLPRLPSLRNHPPPTLAGMAEEEEEEEEEEAAAVETKGADRAAPTVVAAPVGGAPGGGPNEQQLVTMHALLTRLGGAALVEGKSVDGVSKLEQMVGAVETCAHVMALEGLAHRLQSALPPACAHAAALPVSKRASAVGVLERMETAVKALEGRCPGGVAAATPAAAPVPVSTAPPPPAPVKTPAPPAPASVPSAAAAAPPPPAAPAPPTGPPPAGLEALNEKVVVLYTPMTRDQLATVATRKIVTQLEGLGVAFEQLDGMGEKNKELRKALWAHAGAKPGTYPILYVGSSRFACTGEDVQALIDSGDLAKKLR